MRITVTKDYTGVNKDHTVDAEGRICGPLVDIWTDPDARATVDDGLLTVAGINTSAIYAAGTWQQVRIERGDAK